MFKHENQGGKIKPAGYPTAYTDEQKWELYKCSRDPLYFITNYCWIISTEGRMLFDLYEYQRRLIKHYVTHKKTITLLARQSGKALALDTPIITPDGFKAMGDLRVGDDVIGEDGKPAKVTFATDPMYGHKCYRVRFDTDEIIADAEHWWVVTHNSNGHQIKTERLTTEELLPLLEKQQRNGQSIYVPVTEPIEYAEKELRIDPYLLGVWLGDGNSRHCAIYGSKDDLIEITSYITENGYSAKECVKDKRNEVFYRKILNVYPLLKQLDLYANKHIPTEYLHASIEQRLELLRGLMDTDGHCDTGGSCEFYQKSADFCVSFRYLLSSLGIKSRLRQKIVNGDVYHTVSFTTTRFDVFKLKRKLERQHRCMGHPKNERHYIQTIEPVESVPVRCIRVDNESHLFCAGTSMIPTHNTESAAAFLLWWAIFKDDQKILIASYKADAAKAIMKRLKIMYEELPWWLKPGVRMPGGWNVMSVEFENGSQVLAETTTSNTGRGYSINLFYLDEFAYVHPNIADEFWTSIFPTISSSITCRCIITSTANTDEDKFAQIWFNSIQSKYSYDTSATKRVRADDLVEPDYETLYENDRVKKETQELDDRDATIHGFFGFHAPWTEKPGRDHGFMLSVLSSGYTETEWKRDFECQFLTRNETLISPAKLLALNAFVRPPRFVDRWGCRWYEEIKPGTSYGVILDPSEGVERDDACVQVWEFPSMIQVAEWNSNQADQAEQSKMLYRVIRRIYKIQQNDPDHNSRSQIYYSVECNGIGMGILTALELEYEYKIPGYLVDSESNKLRGIRMTAPIKKTRALDMASLIERNIFLPRSRHLVSQLKTFVRKREGVYCAKEGSKDDLVMACILMMQLIEELRVQDDEIQDRLMMEVTDKFDTTDVEDYYGSNYKPFVIIG